MSDYDWQDALHDVRIFTDLMHRAYNAGFDSAGDALHEERRYYILNTFPGADENDVDSLIASAERKA